MTDKQIIIDGVDVSGCEYYFDEKCRCMDASIMQDFYSCPQCNSNPNCNYKNWKRKEQECERLKEARKNSRCAWKSLEGTFCTEVQEQLDQLKAENELYKNAHKTEQDRRRSYEQALIEIKKIAKEHNAYAYCNSKVDIRKILQKCEVLDE